MNVSVKNNLHLCIIMIFTNFILFPKIIFSQNPTSQKFIADAIEDILSGTRNELIEEQLRSKEFIQDQEYARLYPSLVLNAEHGVGEKTPGASFRDSYSSGVELKLQHTLDVFGEDRDRARAARIRADIAKIDFGLKRDELVKEFVLKLIDWSEACVNYSDRLDQNKIISQQYQLLKRQFQQGLKTTRDFSRIDSEMQRSIFQLQQAKSFVGNKRLELQKYLSPKIIQEVGDKLDSCTLSLSVDEVNGIFRSENSKQNALSSSLVSISKLTKEANDKELSATRKNIKYPKVTLNLFGALGAEDYLGDNAKKINDAQYTQWGVGLGISYTIWDHGLSSAKLKLIQQTAKLDALQSDIRLSDAVSDMDINQQRMQQLANEWDAQKRILENEDKIVGIMNADYKQGRVSYIELMDVIQKRLSSRLALSKVAFDWARVRCIESYYQGRIIKEFSK